MAPSPGELALAGRTPDVSVIMPVYNAAATLQRALDSLAAQTIASGGVEFLVVDDGSTDESPAMLDRMAGENPAFRVFHQANSGGPAAPRNFALELVRGRYVFFLDQDDYIAPDTLEAMVRIADANGTDVVLPRMRGVGGRTTIIDMFARTVGRTDVFSSPVYRALNPIKLFRTSMIRTLGLRFSEDVRVYEDQPFVARAYFGCDGISILADKDYVFWVFRDDSSNISLSRSTLADRLPGARRLFELVAENVPPGPMRDKLVRRHFELELMGLFKAYRIERDPSMRETAFAEFRRIVAAHYNEDVGAWCPPHIRILIQLVSEGRSDRLAAYVDALAEASGPPGVVHEGDRVFLALPWFRDPDAALPDDLFDIASKLKVSRRIEVLDIGPVEVGITAICRLGALTEHVTSVSLVTRQRIGAAESAFPLTFRVVRGDGVPYVDVGGTVPVDDLIKAPKGEVRDLYLRVAAGQVWREARMSECASVPRLRVLGNRGGSGGARYGLLTANAKGNLSFCVVGGMGRALYPLKRVARVAVLTARRRLGLGGAQAPS
jgi:glycosyltransferase involved in cell wall biosynthesis